MSYIFVLGTWLMSRRGPGGHRELAPGVVRGFSLETKSLNTRDHPVEALRLLDGRTFSSLGLVTSEWHMCRAQRQFCRHFAKWYHSPRVDGAIL